MYDILELNKKLLLDLRNIGKELDIKKIESFKKQDLIYAILDAQAIKASERRKETGDAPGKEQDIRARRGRPLKRVDATAEKKDAPVRDNQPPSRSQVAAPVVQKRDDRKDAGFKQTPRVETPDVSGETAAAQPANVATKENDLASGDSPISVVEPGNDRKSGPRKFDENRKWNRNDRSDRFQKTDNQNTRKSWPMVMDFYVLHDFNYLNSPDDVYVSQSQIKLFGLKPVILLLGCQAPKEGEKYFPLIKVLEINGRTPQLFATGFLLIT
jgi:transcription termination factor Rho